MVNRISLTFILFFFFLTLLLPGVSLAFNSDTRCQILKDAISICPENLKAYLTEHFEEVHSGIHFADRHEASIVSGNPYEILYIYQSLEDKLRNNDLKTYNTAHQFGVIACFIAETIAPDNYKYFLPKKVLYEGFKEITDVNKNLSMLIEDYRKPYRHSSTKPDREFLYNITVNQIVNYWITLWQTGGQKPGTIKPQGTVIAHQVFEGHISSRMR